MATLTFRTNTSLSSWYAVWTEMPSDFHGAMNEAIATALPIVIVTQPDTTLFYPLFTAQSPTDNSSFFADPIPVSGDAEYLVDFQAKTVIIVGGQPPAASSKSVIGLVVLAGIVAWILLKR